MTSAYSIDGIPACSFREVPTPMTDAAAVTARLANVRKPPDRLLGFLRRLFLALNSTKSMIEMLGSRLQLSTPLDLCY